MGMEIRQIIVEELHNKLDYYTTLISEGLKDPIPTTINKTINGYGGEFWIGKNLYTITIDETSEQCYVFKFTRDDSHELTNDIKKAFQVIPTIEKVVEDFMQQHKPNMFSFFMTDGSSGRDKKYTSFINYVGDKYGYMKYIKKYDDKTKSYILFNEMVKDEDFQELIKYIDQYR